MSEPKVPFPYQLEAVEQLREGARRGLRHLGLTMLMGAGKSLTSFIMMKACQEKGKRCVFVCDRRLLVDQAFREAIDFGLDAGRIMAERTHDSSAMVQFCSKDSLLLWVGENRIEIPPADLVFIDEAHRSFTGQWGLLRSLWPNAVFIYLSATPCKGDGSSLGEHLQMLVQPIKPSELVKMGRVVPGIYFNPYVPDMKGLRATGEERDWSRKQLAKRMGQANLVGDAVGWWQRLGQDRPSIYYCCDQSHAADVRDRFLEAGISCEMLVDDTPDRERECIRLRSQTGETKVVVNVDVLTEGIDWPWVSCIGVLRPTQRFRRYLQMIGRGMRAYPGKSDFIVIDHAGVVLLHGFADEDIEWKLDKEWNADQALADLKLRNQTTNKCPACFTVFKGSVCPTCGATVRQPPGKKDKKQLAGSLVATARDDALPADVRQKALQRVWFSCIVQAIKMNRTAGLAAAIFKNRFGVAPWTAGVQPILEGSGWQQPAREAFASFAPKKRKEAVAADGGIEF